MPLIPEFELEKLKSEVDLLALIRSQGVTTNPKGDDHHACCPFHDDKTPSLVITPSKGLWHCFGCDKGGTAIDWVMNAKGLPFRDAVDTLRNETTCSSSPPIPTDHKPGSHVRPSKPILKQPLPLDADDQALIHQVIDYYHDSIFKTPKALEYLKSRGIHSEEILKTFKLGFADRSLGLHLPMKQVRSGAMIRSRLQDLGLIRDTGHEHFRGSITFPIFDESGNITEIYGRKITRNLRKGTPNHTYLPGPHGGIFNLAGIQNNQSSSMILCESIIDALTFYIHGFTNVTATYGTNGFTDDHLKAIQQHNINTIYIAFDADNAGNKSAQN